MNKDSTLSTFIAAALLSSSVSLAKVAPTESSLSAAWHKLVSKHVDARGAVSYHGFASDRKQLTAYLAQHQKLNAARLSENAKKAVYINLHNALVIAAILNYTEGKGISRNDREKFLRIDIDSLRSVKRWSIWAYQVNLAGNVVSLGDIAHKFLRGQAEKKLAPFKVKALDPRIHMALNFAARSSMPLRNQAYTEKNIEQMLEENMRAFVNSGKHVYWIAARGKIALNAIVLWHYDDFDVHARRVLGLGGAGDYLVSYMSKQTAANTEFVRWLKNSLNNRAKIALRFSSVFDIFYYWRINDTRNFREWW